MEVVNHKLTVADLDWYGYTDVVKSWDSQGYKSFVDKYAEVIPVGTKGADYSFDQWYPHRSTNMYYEAPEHMSGEDYPTIILDEDNNLDDYNPLNVGDTFLCNGVRGYEEDGTILSDHELMIKVVSKDDDNKAVGVKVINGKKIDDVKGCLPEIDDTALTWLANDGSVIYNQLPSRSPWANYCQEFKQVVSADRDAIKKLDDLGYGFSMKDLIRMGKSTLKYGRDNALFFSTINTNFQTTNGVWYSAGLTFRYSDSSTAEDEFYELTRQLSGGNFQKREFIIPCSRHLFETFKTIDGAKLDGSTMEIASQFGPVLKFQIYELFEDRDDDFYGIAFPIGELVKYEYQPLTETYSKDGLTCTISECCALGFKKPNNAMRIIKR